MKRKLVVLAIAIAAGALAADLIIATISESYAASHSGGEIQVAGEGSIAEAATVSEAAPTIVAQASPAPVRAAVGPAPVTPGAAGAPPAPTAVPTPGLEPVPGAMPVPGLPAPAVPQLRKENFQVFILKNADANETVDQLRTVLGPIASIAADSRTNTILASGAADKLAVLEAFIERLDSMESRPSKSDGKNATQKPNPPSQNEGRRSGGYGGIAGASAGGGGGFGGAAGAGTGSGGGFGAGGFRVSGAGSGDTPVAGAFTLGAISDLDQQLRAADAAAKAAEKQLEEASILTKKAAELAALGKSDEAAEVSRRLAEILENQRRAGEQQRRALENQRRAWETQQQRSLRAPARAGTSVSGEQFVVPAEIKEVLRKIAGSNKKGSNEEAELRPMLQRLFDDQETAEIQRKAAEQATQEKYEKAIKMYRDALAMPAETEDAKRNREKLVDDLREKLRATLADNFNMQLETQTREIKQLHQRLEKLEQDVAEREKNGGQLVDRKLKALLNPEGAEKAAPGKSDWQPEPREKQ